MGLGTFISVGRSLETALQRVENAERLGYESVYVTHIAARDSITTNRERRGRSRLAAPLSGGRGHLALRGRRAED